METTTTIITSTPYDYWLNPDKDEILRMIAENTKGEKWYEGLGSAIYEGASSIFGGAADLALKVLNNAIMPVLYWLYELIFEDLLGSCRSLGGRILNSLFTDFSSKSFSLQALEVVCGLCFLIFAVKLTVHIIRG